MWEYSGYSNYHSLQTGINRRFDGGMMFSFFYVWSKALGINNDDFSAGLPNSTDEEIRRLDYSYMDTDRPHNFVANFIYQLPFLKDGDSVVSRIAGDWQVSGIYRWTSGRPQGVGFNIPGIGAANLTGSADGNPNARIVLTCDPGSGYSDDPYAQFNTGCFAPPQPGSDGAESARFFLRQPPINNIDLSLSKAFARSEEPEVRVPHRRVQRAQPHAVHGLQRHRGLREPDRSHDYQPPPRLGREPGATRRLRVRQRRGGAALAAVRHARDVLVRRRPPSASGAAAA